MRLYSSSVRRFPNSPLLKGMRLMKRTQLRSIASRFFELPLARLLVRLHIGANTVTFTGLALSGVVAYLLSQGWFLAGGLGLLLASLLDMLDGAVARLTGTANSAGALLDSVTDRLAEGVVLLGLLVFYAGGDDAGASTAIFLALVFSYLVSYIRARAEGLGIACTVGLVARPERVLLLVLGLLTGWVVVALWAIVGLSALTAAQRLVYTVRHAR